MVTIDNFTRVNNDTNGNPRYVFHFVHISENYDNNGNYINIENQYRNALNLAKKFGGKKFHNKQYGGGIVIQSYNLQDDCNRINELLTEEN